MKAYMRMWFCRGNFSGRSSRKEFWPAFGLHFLIWVTLTLLAGLDQYLAVFGAAYILISLLPVITLSIRRVHDAGKSGASLLWVLLPVVGWGILLILLLQKSDGNNRWGEGPG